METGPLSPAQLDSAIVNDTDAMSRILLTLRPSIDPAQGRWLWPARVSIAPTNRAFNGNFRVLHPNPFDTAASATYNLSRSGV